jgi:hypothetical protein
MLRSFLRTTACLAVSATALIVVTKLDATAAKPRGGGAPETDAPKPSPRKAAPPRPAPPPAPKLTVATMTVPAASTATARAADAVLLTVPDWKGKRLSVARREARKVGLNVTAVDESGEGVPAEVAPLYRVRRQLTKAGTTVEPGADIELRVREVGATAEGY